MTIYVIGTPKKVLGKLKETACHDNFDTHTSKKISTVLAYHKDEI